MVIKKAMSISLILWFPDPILCVFLVINTLVNNVCNKLSGYHISFDSVTCISLVICISLTLWYVFLFFYPLYYAGVGQSCVHLCITCALGYHGIALDGENTVGRSNKMQWCRSDILQYNRYTHTVRYISYISWVGIFSNTTDTHMY